MPADLRRPTPGYLDEYANDALTPELLAMFPLADIVDEYSHSLVMESRLSLTGDTEGFAYWSARVRLLEAGFGVES